MKLFRKRRKIEDYIISVTYKVHKSSGFCYAELEVTKNPRGIPAEIFPSFSRYFTFVYTNDYNNWRDVETEVQEKLKVAEHEICRIKDGRRAELDRGKMLSKTKPKDKQWKRSVTQTQAEKRKR